MFVANDWPCGILPLYVRSLQAPAEPEPLQSVVHSVDSMSAQHAARRASAGTEHGGAPTAAAAADADSVLAALQQATASAGMGSDAPAPNSSGGLDPDSAGADNARGALPNGFAHVGMGADAFAPHSAYCQAVPFAAELRVHEQLLRRRLATAKARF